MTVWRNLAVWAAVADELGEHRRRGLQRLLTEDTVRFAAIKALVAAGADPAGLAVEWPHPALTGSRVDLVAGGTPPGALIEFKYPREPNEKNAAWTMVLGEVLKDFYRLAVHPKPADRLFVYAETERLRRYMAGAGARYGLDPHADHVTLSPADAARLPTTAATVIGTDLAAHHVTARRLASLTVDADLSLSVYTVDPLGVSPDPSALRAATGEAEPSAVPAAEDEYAELTSPVRTRDGARREILAAIRAVLGRSGGTTFTPAQVVTEMARRSSGYAESTIRTMITAHMCHNAPDNNGTTYDDLERVGRGIYRLFPS